MKRLLLLIFLMAALFDAHAVERGLPFMSFYPAKETGGHVQNWDIVQDKRGIMYIGNGHGILEFDCSSWRLIATANKTMAFSLNKDANGRMYEGVQGDFDYREPDIMGDISYASLLNSSRQKDQNFSYVRCTHATHSDIHFIIQFQFHSV